MEIIILLLQILFAFFMGFTTTVSTVQVPPNAPVVEVVPAQAAPSPVPVDGQAAEPQMKVLAVVENVDVLMLEIFPVQIQLQVRGYHPDGCEAPVNVTQRREGNQVFVEIYRTIPAAMLCPMVLQPLDETIRLDGGFEPGTYTITVNGVVTEVRV
jgi:hypothetical protein